MHTLKSTYHWMLSALTLTNTNERNKAEVPKYPTVLTLLHSHGFKQVKHLNYPNTLNMMHYITHILNQGRTFQYIIEGRHTSHSANIYDGICLKRNKITCPLTPESPKTLQMLWSTHSSIFTCNVMERDLRMDNIVKKVHDIDLVGEK